MIMVKLGLAVLPGNVSGVSWRMAVCYPWQLVMVELGLAVLPGNVYGI